MDNNYISEEADEFYRYIQKSIGPKPLRQKEPSTNYEQIVFEGSTLVELNEWTFRLLKEHPELENFKINIDFSSDRYNGNYEFISIQKSNMPSQQEINSYVEHLDTIDQYNRSVILFFSFNQSFADSRIKILNSKLNSNIKKFEKFKNKDKPVDGFGNTAEWWLREQQKYNKRIKAYSTLIDIYQKGSYPFNAMKVINKLKL